MKRTVRYARIYNEFTEADRNYIGFEYDGSIYNVDFKHIPYRYLRIQNEHKNGKVIGQGLYFKFTEADKKDLIARGRAKKLDCTIEDLNDHEGHYNSKGKFVFYNKGVMYEKFLIESDGQIFREKDNVPFYKDGDIHINGVSIQVKYSWARLSYISTLEKLRDGVLTK